MASHNRECPQREIKGVVNITILVVSIIRLRIYPYYTKKVTESTDLDEGELFEEIYINANRLFTSFLSSFRLFVDNIEIYLRIKYGEESETFMTFKSKTRELFHKYFAYRFFYALRNYSQHMYFPINCCGYDKVKFE